MKRKLYRFLLFTLVTLIEHSQTQTQRNPYPENRNPSENDEVRCEEENEKPRKEEEDGCNKQESYERRREDEHEACEEDAGNERTRIDDE